MNEWTQDLIVAATADCVFMTAKNLSLSAFNKAVGNTGTCTKSNGSTKNWLNAGTHSPVVVIVVAWLLFLTTEREAMKQEYRKQCVPWVLLSLVFYCPHIWLYNSSTLKHGLEKRGLFVEYQAQHEHQDH